MLTFQFSALLIFVIILSCWIFFKKITLDNNRIFSSLLLVTGLAILFDICSTYLSIKNIVSPIIQQYVFKTYMIMLLFTVYLYFSYLVSKSVNRKYIVKYIRYSIYAPIIDAILIIMLPLSIKHTELGLDITGGAIICTYICAFVFALLIILLLIVLKDRINRWYRICFVSEATLWVMASIVQIFIQQTGVISIAFSCAIASLFIFAENPLNYINLNYNCFKNNYLSDFLNRANRLKKKMFVIVIDIEDETIANYQNELAESYKKNVIKQLNSIKSFTTFITENNEIYAICFNDDEYEFRKKQFEEMLYKISLDTKQIKFRMIACNTIENFKNSDDAIFYISEKLKEMSTIKKTFVSYEISKKEIIDSKQEEEIKAEIVKALKEDRVEAFVQPIYSISKKKIVCAESLARIRNKNGSYMLPYQFIPVSEKCGLDIQIGDRMIENVCKYLSNPITSDLFESIDINLSVAQCEQQDLAKRIITIVQNFDVAPERINFEITESGYINKMENIEKNIKLLTKYGFGFSLDDFGSGESNLDYLVRMPVKYVKIDMHMIWAYFKNDRAKKVVKSIIKISHEMNLKTIAEGVETYEQFHELSNQGIDMIQGYYFYKSMPINEYAKEVIGKMNESALQKQVEIVNSIYSLSSVFTKMYFINFKENTLQEFNDSYDSNNQSSIKTNPQQLLNDSLINLVKDEHLSEVLEFVDLSTLNNRLKNKKHISIEFDSINCGHQRAFFIPSNNDENDEITNVWFLSERLNDYKRGE